MATAALNLVETPLRYRVFLCNDQASAITGAILPIDGGWTAK